LYIIIFFKFLGWLQTSAKEDININEAITMLLKVIVENISEHEELHDQDSIKLDFSDKKKKQSCRC
jgi:hypothetical protein